MQTYLDSLEAEVSQGDIFTDVPIAYVRFSDDLSEVETSVTYVPAMMLSHGCDYDKPSSHFALFAEIRPLSEVGKDSQGHIRQYRTLHTFYLPASGEDFPESYVDLRRIDRVAKVAIQRLYGINNRIYSLTREAQEGLRFQIVRFFGVDR